MQFLAFNWLFFPSVSYAEDTKKIVLQDGQATLDADWMNENAIEIVGPYKFYPNEIVGPADFPAGLPLSILLAPLPVKSI